MKRLKFAGSFILILLSLSQNPLVAQWNAIGPEGGYVKCMARHNGIMYAVTGDLWFTASAFYRSEDEGTSWQMQSDGSLPDDVRDIVVTEDHIFAGTGSGVFRSDDGGAHWIEKNNGMPAGEKWINHLALSGTSLFAAGTPSGMLRSVDMGENWTVCTTGLTDTYIYSLLATEEAVFAGTGDQMLGVYKTTNNGNSWQQANTGMSYYADGIWHSGYYPQITCMAISGNMLFAGTGENQGIWKSENLGGHWTHCGEGTMNYTQYSSISGDGTKVFAGTMSQGLIQSGDNGQSWTATNSGLMIAGEVNAILVNGNDVFTGTKGGVYHSIDGGQNWTAASAGLMAQKVTQPGFALLGEDLFLGTEAGGIFNADEAGTTWINRSGLLPFDSWNLNALYANETALFAWDRVSLDGGLSWEMASDYSPGTSVYGYNGPRWIVHQGYWFAFGTGDNPTVYRSGDHGQTWQPIPAGIAGGTAFFRLYSSGESLYLASSSGLYLSTDAGNSWQLTAFPDLNYWSLNGAEFHVQNGIHYCGLRGGGGTMGIFVSTNNGLTWTKRSDFLVHQFAEAGAAVACSGLNLELVNGEWVNVPRIMLSQNGGQSWNIIGETLSVVSTLTLTGYDGKLFVAASNSSGNSLWCSADAGGQWVEIGNGIAEGARINDLIIYQNKLYAGTNGQSVWWRSMDAFAPPAQPGPIAGPVQPCEGNTVLFTVEGMTGVTYNWQLPAGWTLVSGNGTAAVSVVAGDQTGLVLVVPSNGFGIGPAQFVQVAPIAPIATPTIVLVNDTLFSDASNGNQWYLNGELIPGATHNFYVPLTNGDYSVMVSTGDCSSEMSNVISIILEGLAGLDDADQIHINPNPASESFTFQLEGAADEGVHVRLINNFGRVVMQQEMWTDATGRSQAIDVSQQPAGLYFLELVYAHHFIRKKLIINK